MWPRYSDDVPAYHKQSLGQCFQSLQHEQDTHRHTDRRDQTYYRSRIPGWQQTAGTVCWAQAQCPTRLFNFADLLSVTAGNRCQMHLPFARISRHAAWHILYSAWMAPERLQWLSCPMGTVRLRTEDVIPLHVTALTSRSFVCERRPIDRKSVAPSSGPSLMSGDPGPWWRCIAAARGQATAGACIGRSVGADCNFPSQTDNCWSMMKPHWRHTLSEKQTHAGVWQSTPWPWLLTFWPQAYSTHHRCVKRPKITINVN